VPGGTAAQVEDLALWRQRQQLNNLLDFSANPFRCEEWTVDAKVVLTEEPGVPCLVCYFDLLELVQAGDEQRNQHLLRRQAPVMAAEGMPTVLPRTTGQPRLVLRQQDHVT